MRVPNCRCNRSCPENPAGARGESCELPPGTGQVSENETRLKRTLHF